MEWDDFKEQINYLNRNYNILSFQELSYIIKSGDNVPKNSVVLTFDDGYRDHFDVYRFLKKMNISGVFFPVASVLESRTILDVNKIHFILNSVPNHALLIDEIHLYLRNAYKDEFISIKEELQRNFMSPNRWDVAKVNYIKRVLQVGLPHLERVEVCDILFKKYVSRDLVDFSNELYLGIDDIIEMSNEGMEIGSHGYSHNWLNSMSMTDQELDIDLSLVYLRSLGLCQSQFLFCYPYGAYNEDTLNVLREKGCDGAFTCIPEKHNLSEHNILEIRRFDTNDITYNT